MFSVRRQDDDDAEVAEGFARQAEGRSRTYATGFHPEAGERRGQEKRMVLAPSSQQAGFHEFNVDRHYPHRGVKNPQQ